MGSVFLNDKEASKGLDNIDKKASGVGNKFTNMIGTVAKWSAGIIAAGGAAGAGLLAFANKSAETTDRIDKLSQKIGISRESFQEWDFILSQNGASIEGLQTGMKTLSRAADEAAQGTATYSDVFDRLNISVTDSNGNLKEQEVLFNETILALSQMENETERSALASQLLGKSATELAPMLNSGSASIEELRAKANELGLVLNDEAVDAGVKFTDTIDQLKRASGAIFTQLGTDLIPIMQKMADWVIENMPMIREKTKVAFETAGKVINVVIEVIKGAIEAIKSLSQFFIEHWDILQPILAGITAGAATFGLYTLAINASAIATAAWTTVTTIATAAGTAFGAVIAFLTSPIGIVVAAIAGLVAAGVLLYKNWDEVSAWAGTLWDNIKTQFSKIGDFIAGIWDGIKSGASSAFDGISNIIKGYINIYIRALNFFIKALNKIKFDIPDWVPGLGGKGFGINIPQIPMLKDGAVVNRPTLAMIGEAGTEAVVPLDKAGQYGFGGVNSTANITVLLDGKTIAKAIRQPLADQVRVTAGVRI
jgi:phage-related minor tail protein